MLAMMRSFFRPATAVAGAVLLAVVAPAAPAAAAPPSFTFRIDLGSNYVDGTGPNNDDILLVLRDRANFVKDRAPATTDGTGSLNMTRGFHATIENGDKIQATDGVPAHARTFAVPRIAATINRVTNVVSGKGPAGQSVDVSACVANSFDGCTDVGPFNVPVNSNGDWSYDFSPTNLRGGDDVDVEWSDAAGDSVRRQLTVPFVAVVFGGNTFFGTAARGSVVGMSLRDGNGNLKAKTQSSAAALFGSEIIYFGEWRKQSYAVNVRAGDRIAGTFASDATITVPRVETIPNAGTDRIRGHCFNNAFFEVSARHADGSDSSYYDGTTGANGTFNIDITTNNAAYDLLSDDEILLQCQNSHGDSIGNSFFGLLMATNLKAARTK